MPRTRSQAVVSPLVSLDTPRRKRRTAATTLTKPSADTQEVTVTKAKRGRKPTKKEISTEIKATEVIPRTKSEIETHETQLPQIQTQEPKEENPKEEVPQGEISNPEVCTAKAVRQDNGSSIPATTPKMETDQDSDSPMPSSLETTPNVSSPIKRHSIRKALITIKDALKKPSQSIRDRLHRLRSPIVPNGDSSQTVAATESAPETNYSLAEDEILDAALEILLHRMESDKFQHDPFVSSSFRCPCCQNALKLECPQGHNMQSWVPDDAKEAMNAVLTTLLAEGIIANSEEKENARRSQEEVEIKFARQVEDQRNTLPRTKKKTDSSAKPSIKQKGKKRARDSNDDDIHNDEAPKAQRPRLTSSAEQTPFKRRATTTPRRRLPFAEIRRRAMERELGNGPPSMFRLDEAIAQHEAQEKAEQATKEAVEEAAEADRLQSITRAAMERHAILGPIPDHVQNTFEVPIFNDGLEDTEVTEVPETSRTPRTPSSSAWGFNIQNFFTSVTGSVRRFVPQFRNPTDQAVPFVAGGGPTPTAIDGSAGPITRSRSNVNGAPDMDLTYSLFPAPMELPQTLPDSRQGGKKATNHVSDETISTQPQSSSEENANGNASLVGRSTALASGKDQAQIPVTQNKANQDISNVESMDADTQAEPKNGNKKRKRAPSPDVIPNPPGCSYGMDLDYFTYSDDEFEEASVEAEAEAEAVPPAPKTAPTSVSNDSASTARPAEKRTRFLSPDQQTSDVPQTKSKRATESPQPYQAQIPPGWARPTTTVYNGEMFKGMASPHTPIYHTPQAHRSTPVRSRLDTARPQSRIYPASGSLSDIRREHLQRRTYRAGPGTPCRPLNTSVNTGPLTEAVRQSVKRTTGSRFLSVPGLSGHELEKQLERASQQPPQQSSQQPSQQPPATSMAAHESASEQQSATAVSSSDVSSQASHDRADANNTITGVNAVAKSNVRNETTSLPPIQPVSAASRGQPVTERNRPKTPSRLRNHVPLSSSPLSQASPTKQMDQAQTNQQDLLQVFGNDEFGRQAYDIYKSCPSGDLSKVQWPSFDPLSEDSIQQLINSTPMSESEQKARHESFQKSFEQFQSDFDQGLIDPDEILSDLPL